MGIPEGLEVYTGDASYMERAKELAEKLSVPLRMEKPEEKHANLILHLEADGLSLEADGLSMRGDLTSMIPRLKRNNLMGELLVKAAKLKNLDGIPVAVDATAGMGEDSLLLAAAGFQVLLFEYDPVIAVLLQDSLERAKEIPELSVIVNRMQFAGADSIEGMKKLDVHPDVILLDPMFPERSKSGLIKKKFQLLQKLESPCSQEDALLQAAKAARPAKIVIKRPAKGPYLAGAKPSYSLKGKAIRYDCMINL